MRLSLIFAALAGVLASPAAAALGHAAAPAPVPVSGDCPLWIHRPAAPHTITLADGHQLRADDPYGGLLARNRLFFQFSVRGAAADIASIAKVTWALDGTVARTDDRPGFDWRGSSGSNRRMPAGDHQITVTATPKDGSAPASTTFGLRATDCQPATAMSLLGIGHGPKADWTLSAESSYEAGTGPTLTAVTWRIVNGRAVLPAKLRGRTVGRLTVSAGGRSTPRRYTLRAPRRGTTLLAHGALRVVLRPGRRDVVTVTGLPSGTREATVELRGSGTDLLVRRDCGLRFGADATIHSPQGTVVVPGGRTSGGCR